MEKLVDLQCEYQVNPTQINTEIPRFSWKIEANGYNLIQTSWEITIMDKMRDHVVWHYSEESNKSVHVEYKGEPLKENTKYEWNVKVTLNNGKSIESKEKASFETGLWDSSLWQGIWIGQKNRADLGRCPYFRKKFVAKKEVKRAKLFITACGLYELSVNGVKQDKYLLTPGWSNYNDHLQYLAYDITSLIKTGENVIGVRAGEGWYCGEISFNHQTKVYGDDIAIAAILILEYEDCCEYIKTDKSWKVQDSGILSASLYNGEEYDLTLESSDWDRPEFDDSDWRNANVFKDINMTLTGMINEGTERIEVLEPKEIIHTPKGETVIDMGQNMTGWMRIRIKAKTGDIIRVKHGEVLDKEGNFYSGNLRLAQQEDKYILRGGENILEPHFTYHGFRYVKIIEFPNEVKKEYFEGIVLHTAMKPTIQFETSNNLLNQLWHNIVWGQKGNFLDVPTDCPQRDERLGWTGDAQIFCRTACYNFQADAFFSKWLEDVKADQYSNGAVPFVVPDVLPKDWRFLREGKIGSDHTSAAWADAITICPWTLYKQYGDKRILEITYAGMKKYIDYIYNGAHYGSGNPYIWDWGPQLGDWLALDSEPGSYRGATDETFIATAYYAYSTEILSKCANILDIPEDEEYYCDLHEKIKENFRKLYLHNSEIVIETQTAQLVPLYFGLLNGNEIDIAVKKLLELLEKNEYHLTTGFVGTPYLCHVLSEYGYSDLAYTVLLQQDFPSWLYQITKGATTIWEHWDGERPDGSFWSDDMNSFNHYAYGSIGEWLYRKAAGIDMDEENVGFGSIVINPQIDPRLSYLYCIYDSIHGKITSSWQIKNDIVKYHVIIPANTKARLYLADGSIYSLGSGEYQLSCRLR